MIKEGYLADLLLVDGDPIADVRILQDKNRMLAIMKDGKFHKAPRMNEAAPAADGMSILRPAIVAGTPRPVAAAGLGPVLAARRRRAGVAVPGGLAGLADRDPDLEEGFVSSILNGITLAGLYFLVASGFTLVFGLMRNVNLAHGSLYLLGAYIGYEVTTRTGYWLLGVAAGFAVAGAGRRWSCRCSCSAGWKATISGRRW